MAAESGKNGTVKIAAAAVADITKWEFDKEVETDRYASNSTAGFKATVAGVQHGKGTIEGKWDSSLVSPIKDNTSATLQLHTNAGELYSVPSIIKTFKLTVDIDTGKVNAFTATFETNGAWTEPTLT